MVQQVSAGGVYDPQKVVVAAESCVDTTAHSPIYPHVPPFGTVIEPVVTAGPRLEGTPAIRGELMNTYGTVPVLPVMT